MTNQLNHLNFSSSPLVEYYLKNTSVKDENLSCVAVIGTLGATSCHHHIGDTSDTINTKAEVRKSIISLYYEY